MTSERASLPETRANLISRFTLHPFPKYEERAGWNTLPDFVKNHFVNSDTEKKILDYTLPNLSATNYMQFARTDDYSAYQGLCDERRRILCNAVLAECIEGQGKYIDKIIDIVWAICEESSWISPGANNHMHNHMWSGIKKNALPDVTDYCFIDLAAGSTASLLSWTYYFLRDRLDEETPLVCKRIELELYKRIVIPFMHHDDLTWFGFYGHKINNWIPWILENIMPVAAVVLKDPDLRVEFMARALEKMDIYIEDIKPDGGCDEGPGYWGAAGVALFDCLDELKVFSDGKWDFFGEEKIKNIGEYITKAHLKGDVFANFADNTFRQSINGATLYRFGECIASDRLKAFATNFITEKSIVEVGYQFLFRLLQNLFRAQEAIQLPKQEIMVQDDWFPDTELFYAHDHKNQIAVAAKGGFNNESHNHNDLGSFIVAYEDSPILVDLGCLPYMGKTFSPYRYEIWILQSAWHNCAKLGGFDQHNGDEYKAKVLDCTMNAQKASLSMELKGAYEVEAGIESYLRTMELDKENSTWTVTDDVKMQTPSEIEFHFVTTKEPQCCGDVIEIPVDETHIAKMKFDAGTMDYSVDIQDLESESLKKGWQSDVAYRIHLTAKEKTTACRSTIVVSVEER